MTNRHLPIMDCCRLGCTFPQPQHPHQQPNDGLSTPAGVLTHWSWHFLCFSSFHHPPSAHPTKNCHINFYHSTPSTANQMGFQVPPPSSLQSSIGTCAFSLSHHITLSTPD